MRASFTVACLSVVLGATQANAATRTFALSNVGVMVSSAGESRFLLGTPWLMDTQDLSIDRAVIEIPLPASQLTVDVRVVAWPVHRPWIPGILDWDAWFTPGGDVRDATRGRGEVVRGTSRTRLALDVTGSLREVAKGEPFYGFLLTVPPAYGAGFDVVEATALQGALSGATLSVTYLPRYPDDVRRR